MEDVLEVYQRPYDGNEVLVCMDETSKQQVKETRVPRPAAPGLSAAYDYEYERNGVSSLFMLFAPLDGWRRVEVRERRTKVDWNESQSSSRESPFHNSAFNINHGLKVTVPCVEVGRWMIAVIHGNNDSQEPANLRQCCSPILSSTPPRRRKLSAGRATTVPGRF